MGRGRILIVEDDPDIVELVAYNLDEEGYETLSALDGQQGIASARQHRPDLIILDIMLPECDGFEVCRTLKADPATAQIPILILSAKSQETDKVVGLELGADDYVTKPFSPRELIARVRAILRRSRAGRCEDRIERGMLVIDKSRHEVSVGKTTVSLTSTEFRLLELLARRPGVVFSREQILQAVAGPGAVVCDRTVDAHIKSLRRKLGEAKHYIETIRGIGYRFKDA